MNRVASLRLKSLSRAEAVKEEMARLTNENENMLKQARADAGFEPLYRLAHIRLAGAQQFGRPGKAGMPGNGDENCDVVNGKRGSRHSIRFRR